MNVTLENDTLVVKIKDQGAELFSVVHKQHKQEYMWNGDPKFWGRTSPTLFPFIGLLKDNMYIYKDKRYTLEKHGFVRDVLFQMSNQQADSVTYTYTDNAKTLKVYPFKFSLSLTYKIEHDMLHVTYEVKNTGNERMYFSVGGHPAFKIPLVEGTLYEDHYIQFDSTETGTRIPIESSGLVSATSTPYFTGEKVMRLTRDSFKQDAIVLQNLTSEAVTIKSDKHARGLTFYVDQFPYLGIWAAANADFVCIEPWHGLPDNPLHNYQLTEKRDNIILEPNKTWFTAWKARFF